MLTNLFFGSKKVIQLLVEYSSKIFGPKEMQVNMQVEGINNGESEQASCSDDGQLLVALRKMMEKELRMMDKELEVMVIRIIERDFVPIIGDLVQKIVQEEIQAVEKRLSSGGTRNTNEITMSKETSLQLKFLDEVSCPVLTGKILKGKGGNSLTVALVDRATGQVVNCGPESRAKVEILVLDASHDDNEHTWTLEKFNNKIIGEGDKKKPHFAKSMYIYLKEGVGVLSNAKLGHDSSWTKSCKCRLGARIIESFSGVSVQEGTTKSFKVSDCRSKLYGKHYPPSLFDEVWRLDNIGKDGDPRKRLNNENVWTVQDFLLLLSLDPQRLQRTVGGRAKMWEVTVDHARTCIIDYKRMYLHSPSIEPKVGVVFDALGELKGMIIESHYVPVNSLSDVEKDCAKKLLFSAFENKEERISFDDEASLLQKFPYRSRSDTNASSIQEGPNGSGLCISDINDGCPIEPATSSQSIDPYIGVLDHSNNMDHVGFLESIETGQTYDPNDISHFAPLGSPTMGHLYEPPIPSCEFSSREFILELFGDNERLMSLINREESLREESATHNAQAYRFVWSVVNAMLWVRRAKKRTALALRRDIDPHKKQRT